MTLPIRILRDTDLVYIDPINGWHYHMKECWMAGPKEITLSEVVKLKPRIGKHFIPCACVRAYESGRDVISYPFFRITG